MTDPDELNHARAREPPKSPGGQRAIKWKPRVAAIAARRHIHIHTAATSLHLPAELALQLTARIKVAPGRLQRWTREGVGGGTAPLANVGSRRRATAGQIQLFNTTHQKGRGGERPATLLAYATAAESSKRGRADFLLASSLYSPSASPSTHSPSQLIPSLVASLGRVPGMNWSPTVAPQPGNGRQLVGP